MAHPSYITKTLRMKPEVSKIFDDLEQWHDHCRFEMMAFNPSDLYKSREYKEFMRNQEHGERRARRERRQTTQSE